MNELVVLKFGLVIQIDSKIYVYLDSIGESVYLAQIIDKEHTSQILARYKAVSHDTRKRDLPIFKVVKLTTKEFIDLGAYCHKTANDAHILEYALSKAGELNKKDKDAIIDEILADDFSDQILQESLKDKKSADRD